VFKAEWSNDVMHGTVYIRKLDSKKGKLFLYSKGQPMNEDTSGNIKKHLRRYNQMLVDSFHSQSME
jgi:hypothetical protein